MIRAITLVTAIPSPKDADTSLRLATAISQIGESLLASISEVSVAGGVPSARACKVSPNGVENSVVNLDLRELTHVLVRIDPPIDLAYIDFLRMLLGGLARSRALILNPAEQLLGMSERFPSLPGNAPDSLVSACSLTLARFAKKHKCVMAKSLSGCNGHEVRLLYDDASLDRELRRATENSRRPLLLQQVVPDAGSSEFRIWYANGRAIAGAWKRRAHTRLSFDPECGDTLQPLQHHHLESSVSKCVGDFLRERRVWFAAVDFIGNIVIDINVTSPGLLVEAEAALGTNLADLVVDALPRMVD